MNIEFIKETQDNLDNVKHLLGDGLYLSLCQITRYVFKGLTVEHICDCEQCLWRRVTALCGMLDDLPNDIRQTVISKNLVHVQLLKTTDLSIRVAFSANPSFWKNKLEELSRH
jgi:hypothetical protein